MSEKRKICVVTGTRAEYGIMSRLMQTLKDDEHVELQIIATNMHLSPEFGMTVNEIENDGFVVNRKVEMLLSSDTAVGTVKSMGVASIGFADAYQELNPDLIIILGDRYEMLAAASAALIFGIPIAHLHGGEITEGAYDDSIRHAITKLSFLHFTSTEEYRKRVIQMGESPDRVFWTGALGVENIKNETLLTKKELESSLGHTLDRPFLIVTFHPVTSEHGTAIIQTESLLKALQEKINHYQIIFTLPNSDTDGRVISRMIKEWSVGKEDRVIIVPSLGRKRYYSALKYCDAIIGNSSSGLIEAPSFKKPTLNIGRRQQGRAQGNTVINCNADYLSIKDSLDIVLSEEFKNYVKDAGVNPYHKTGTQNLIHKILIQTPLNGGNKKFYNINF